MKRQLYILLIIALIAPHAHAKSKDTPSSPIPLLVGAMGGAAICVASFFAGQISEANKDNIEIERMKMEKQAKQDAEKKEVEQFHAQKKLERFIYNFRTYHCTTDPEFLSDAQQLKLRNEIMATTGSIHACEEQVARHLAFYQSLAPQGTHALEESYNKLLWLQRALYTNKYIKEQKELEIETRYLQAKRTAHLKKIEGKVKLQEEYSRSIAQLPASLQDIGTRIACQISNRVGDLTSQLERTLADQAQKQDRQNTEFKKTLDKIAKEQEAHRITLDTLEKLAAPTPSAPPAYNPDYKPEYAPSAPSA